MKKRFKTLLLLILTLIIVFASAACNNAGTYTVTYKPGAHGSGAITPGTKQRARILFFRQEPSSAADIFRQAGQFLTETRKLTI